MNINRISTGDCLERLADHPPATVDLAFADPPFNIGLDYPDHDDQMPADQYLAWLNDCFAAVRRVLTPTGSLFVAIGQHFQAEVLVLLKQLGFHWRNTVIWHYGFGPAQRHKFTPSWTAIHYVTIDAGRFTFNRDAVRVPSARQLVYGDRRASPGGKTPDDVWLLRPQDAEGAGLFAPDTDAWHVRRECGTFRECVGHVCQMPLAVLVRIVLVASNPGDLVLDPFAGTGTTLVAAKKWSRQFVGVEKCEQTAEIARRRLDRQLQAATG
jgi:DNA modification methylase